MANEGAGQAHTVFRVLQILTLIPAWALMAAVTRRYNGNNIDTPGGVLTLFIVTLLASVWSFCILIAVLRAGNTALWIAFWDIVAMGALIAGVATTSNIANYECNAVGQSTTQTVFITSDGQRITAVPTGTATDNRTDFSDNPNNCNLIKAAWGLAIANIIMFFITAILAVVVCKQNEQEMEKNRTVVIEDAPVVEKVYTDPAGYPERPRRARRSHGHHSRSSRSPRPRSYVYDERL
ncbi:hypothetical protein BZA05DRAFT_429081 [Tricharina praecox]|uniref:uncharacterized protein n=1 Tax=Tricharina praecox TaxID=43433 RepID=UPI002220CFF5|nr:uncharacterized protein BZA05DRAFT_429081 [Tricharina praecox]KAI5856027.1 hypothetical protein BZA05DRAFT_429081 [Tricharina praecox]